MAVSDLRWSTWDLCSLIRDQTHLLCVGRQILNHWTTREVPDIFISTATSWDFSGWRGCCGPPSSITEEETKAQWDWVPALDHPPDQLVAESGLMPSFPLPDPGLHWDWASQTPIWVKISPWQAGRPLISLECQVILHIWDDHDAHVIFTWGTDSIFYGCVFILGIIIQNFSEGNSV